MPGEAGNFAVAAHRTTWGKPFNRIAELHVDDAIVIETPDGWYTYRFRTLEYVTPDEVEVLLPVPQAMDVPAGDRLHDDDQLQPDVLDGRAHRRLQRLRVVHPALRRARRHPSPRRSPDVRAPSGGCCPAPGGCGC